ncbi:hypothetical protein N865_12780 [Intrasporangium oryzae NRRL B-24470]|uniref:DUF4349 domain-containing protein n=1 Tax=Intrasporangium oryzae NRRL B-24470 TaxID=1386089 RepID=W9GDK1_9MICO|nr:DUF4349 domain-containing protein [Intrasporangium oryzae]EWT01934.1 hypothetical protein N865_12780 [Intrasporangium oryzae NRRL B-24470]
MSATTARTGRRHRLVADHRKTIGWVVAVIALVALSIPVGLAARDGRGGAATSSSGFAGSAAVDGSSGAPEPASGSTSGRGSGSGSGSASDSAGIAPGAPAKGSAADAAGAQAAAADPLGGPKIARTAWLGIEVTDLTASSGRVRAIATAADGQVVSENVVTGSDPTGGYGPDGMSGGAPKTSDGTQPSVATEPVGVNEARLTIRVPAERLDAVLAELSRVGTVSYRSSQSEDVTETYVDTKARMGPAQDSITSIRALMLKATDLQQIVLLESELTRRQAELDSLVQRLAELERRTTTSDVTVTLWTAGVTPVATVDSGFVATLRAAWDHLLASVGVIVTGLAVLLPWLLIGLIVAWVVRRMRLGRNRPATGGSAPAGD